MLVKVLVWMEGKTSHFYAHEHGKTNELFMGERSSLWQQRQPYVLPYQHGRDILDRSFYRSKSEPSPVVLDSRSDRLVAKRRPIPSGPAIVKSRNP